MEEVQQMSAPLVRATHQRRSLLRFALQIGLAAGAVLFQQAPAWSDDPYPSRNIFLVVPLAAGGPTDAVARIISPGLSKALGVNVVVENRVGANNQIAVDYIAQRPADGYTLILAATSTAMVGMVNKGYTGDIANDL